jgi:hypothetical protein
MTRAQAEDIVNNVLYGTDTDTGRHLAGELIEEMGTAALTDRAVIRLAQLHQQMEHIQMMEAERRHRGGY